MKLSDLPEIAFGFDAGPEDRIFDSLLVLGPLIIGLVIVLNRSIFTEALAIAYIGVFLTYVLYQGVGPGDRLPMFRQ